MPINNIVEHDISEIIQDFPGVTKTQMAHHVEACLVCLDNQEHVAGVPIDIQGDTTFSIILNWSDVIDEHIKRSWNDLQEATEYGATALAILMIIKHTDYTIIERSAKGTGFDYYLLEEELYDEQELFPSVSSRLEVSGILKADNDTQIKSRISEKMKQATNLDANSLSALIIVVEFSRPEIHMVEQK